MALGNRHLAVVVRDQFTAAAVSKYDAEDALVLNFSGPAQNLNNDQSQLERVIRHPLSSPVLDLYNIALVVYASDLFFKRNSRTGFRTVPILISVSDKARWDSIKDHLEEVLRKLTNGDLFTFHFVQGRALSRTFRYSQRDDRVASLFSGGLDSLAGARSLIANDEDPILVSHRSQNQITKVQSTLVEALRRASGKRIPHCSIAARKTFPPNEYTQFSRSFLYLTLAAVVALEIGLGRIMVFENGVIATNLPISPGRVFGNTRTTHPAFLTGYQEMLRNVFSANIDVDNPFFQNTKGEVIRQLDHDQYREMVRTSVSCSDRGAMRYDKIQTSKMSHCGKCLPCIIRRVGIHFAGLWDFDAQYSADICAPYDRIPVDAVKILSQILDQGRQIEGYKTAGDAIEDMTELRVVESVEPTVVLELYKRHIKQFKDFLEARANRSLKQKLIVS